MIKAICEVESFGQFLFNRHVSQTREPNESWEEYEQRIWRERVECNGDDEAFLNQVRFKKSIIKGAEWKNISIPGEGGQSKYQKLFRGGLMVMNSILLKVHKADIDPLKLFTAPKPKQPRRWIWFPKIEEWSGILEINILDEKITQNIFHEVIVYAGLAIGIGAMRPENGGDNGRYQVIDVIFEKM